MIFKSYLIYSASTGEIIRSGVCKAEDFLLQLTGVGEGVIEGEGLALTHYVQNGTVQAYTEEQKTLKATFPMHAAYWSNSSMSWVDARTLDQAKQEKWTQLKAQRDAACEAPKMTSVGLFDAYPPDQNNLNKVIALVKIAAERGYPATANYTLATNERVTLTLTQLETAALEMGAQVQGLYDAFDVLRQQVNAATTKEEVTAVVYEA